MAEPVFERFPHDGLLYRLVWAGRVCPTDPDMATARVKIWLVLIDDSNPAALRFGRRQPSGAPSTVELEESAGSLPKMTIGSFWRDGALQTGYSMPTDLKMHDEVLPPQEWIVTRLTGRRGQDGKVFIGADEYPLQGEDKRGALLNFSDAPLIRGRTKNGVELLIPCYEIFRRFYAVTSELANAMLSGNWRLELEKLIEVPSSGLSKNGEFYEIVPRGDLRDVACTAIAFYMMEPNALKEASQVAILINNARRRGFKEPWIFTKPPWADQEMELSFVGHRLRSGEVLVLWIYKSPFPNLKHPVVRNDSVMQVPIVDPNAVSPSPRSRAEGGIQGEAGARILPATDARLSSKAVRLDIGESWDPTVRIKRTAVTTQFVTMTRQVNGESQTSSRARLTTGKKSQTGRASAASLSSEAQNVILNRFHALAECFDTLLKEGYLSSRSDHALVRPVEIGGSTYCEFPKFIGGEPHAWSIIGHEEARPRLCWVSEVTMPEAGVYYWFEVEAEQREAFRALIVKPRSPGAKLGMHTLEMILKLGARNKGQWRENAMSSIEEEVTWHPVRHSYESGRLRRSVVLGGLRSINSFPKR